MPYVPVPKDLTKVKTKLAFNLTKRQLICFSLAGLVGLPVYFFTRGAIGNSAAVLLMIGLMMPFFFFAMYERDGQPADPIPVHFTVGNALLDRLRGICFQPGKKAAFFRRLGTGRLSFALLCIGSGLFGLPDVFLQTLFLSFLLFVFWQSL